MTDFQIFVLTVAVAVALVIPMSFALLLLSDIVQYFLELIDEIMEKWPGEENDDS